MKNCLRPISVVLLGILMTTQLQARISEPKDQDLAMNSPEIVKYWETILNRNEDNAAGVVLNQQNHVSAYVATQFAYTSKRGDSSGADPYANTTSNNKGKTSLGLPAPEVYFDSQINPWARAHIATSYDQDFTTTVTTASYPTQMFFPEADVELNNFNQANAQQPWWFTKIGRQFVNFTSNQYTVINAPLTANLGLTNATAVTVGVANWHGFYSDIYGYNGTPYNAGSVTVPNLDSQNTIHGWGGEIGYSQNTAQGGFTVFADYINNLADSIGMQNNLGNVKSGSYTAIYPDQQRPGYALHADYHTGPFTVLADYVAMVSAFNKNVVGFNGNGANLRAYAFEADYSFTLQKPQTISVGYQGSENAVQFFGVGSGFSMLKNRTVLGYKYGLAPNIALKFEYMYDRDYNKSDVATYGGQSYTGSGGVNNTLQGRIIVTF